MRQSRLPKSAGPSMRAAACQTCGTAALTETGYVTSAAGTGWLADASTPSPSARPARTDPPQQRLARWTGAAGTGWPARARTAARMAAPPSCRSGTAPRAPQSPAGTPPAPCACGLLTHAPTLTVRCWVCHDEVPPGRALPAQHPTRIARQKKSQGLRSRGCDMLRQCMMHALEPLELILRCH